MDCNLIIKRLREHLGVKNDTELGKILGVTQGAVSGWRTRNSIDMALIIDTVKDLDLNWLVRGGEKQQIVVYKEVKVDTSALETQISLYKDLYEKKCAECEAANQRLDNLIDKLGVFGGKLQSTVTMLNDSGENNYNGEGK